MGWLGWLLCRAAVGAWLVPGAVSPVLLVLVGWCWWVGVRSSAARCWWPLVIRSVQGHRWERRRMRRRPVVMRRAATASSRSRRRLGSQVRAGWSGQASSWVQVSSSAARLDQFEPDLVLGERLQRQVGQAGVLEPTDAVLGACAQSVADFQVGQPPAAGVGGEHGDPPAVVVGDAQLGARMGTFPAGDDPHPRRPAGEGGRHPAGQLGDVGAVAGAAVGIEGGRQACFGQRRQRVLDGLAGRRPPPNTANPKSVDVPQQPLDSRTGVAAHQHPRAAAVRAAGPARRRAPRSDRRQSLALARPGRSIPANGSPVPPAPWSTKASMG